MGDSGAVLHLGAGARCDPRALLLLFWMFSAHPGFVVAGFGVRMQELPTPGREQLGRAA